MTLKFSCPSCGQRISAEKKQFGQQGHCPSCNAPIVIPELSEHSPPTPSDKVNIQTRNPANCNAENSGCGSGCSGILGGLLLILLIVFGIAKCNERQPPGGKVTRSLTVGASDYGDRWPLTVYAGTIQCREFNGGQIAMTFTTPDGSIYGLDGTAISHGYRDILAITKKKKLYDGDIGSYYSVIELILDGLK